MRLAFYKAKGTFLDRAIRYWTRQRHSHCEFVFSDGLWFSASPRDQGTRFKPISANPESWDFVELPLTDKQERFLRIWCYMRRYRKYDWLGIFLCHLLPMNVQDPKKYFCSEVMAEGLQRLALLPTEISPASYTPGDLFEIFSK